MTIENQFWTGNKLANHHKYQWPQIHKPAASEWAHWQHCLTISLNLGKQQRLLVPLGR